MKTCVRVLLCCLFALFCLLLGAGIGSVAIPVGDECAILLSKLFGTPLSSSIAPITASIFWTIRLPRAVMAFLVGGALAASGTVMQSVLRNPLASSYTLGVSSGASLGASLVLLTGFAVLGRFTLPLAGFASGLLTVFVAIGLTVRFDKSMKNQTIILVGMVLGLFVNAVLTMITAFSGDSLKQLVFWQMGSFSGVGWTECGILLLFLLFGLIVLSHYGMEMDLMTFGEEQALSAGVPMKRVKMVLLSITALLTGAVVSFVGIIGFLDLIAPHITRKLFGSRHRLLVPMSAVMGGGFMVLCDLLSRVVLSPHELPIGAVTALIGAPFFAFLFFYRGKKHA